MEFDRRKSISRDQIELRAVIPFKKPAGSRLTTGENRDNTIVPSNRIIDKRCFGGESMLWTIMETKLKWSEECYDVSPKRF